MIDDESFADRRTLLLISVDLGCSDRLKFDYSRDLSNVIHLASTRDFF